MSSAIRIVLRTPNFQQVVLKLLQYCPNHLPEDPRNVKNKGPRETLYEKECAGMKQTQNLSLCTQFSFIIEQFQCKCSPNLAVKLNFLFKYMAQSVSTWDEGRQASRRWKWKDTKCSGRNILLCSLYSDVWLHQVLPWNQWLVFTFLVGSSPKPHCSCPMELSGGPLIFFAP